MMDSGAPGAPTGGARVLVAPPGGVRARCSGRWLLLVKMAIVGSLYAVLGVYELRVVQRERMFTAHMRSPRDISRVAVPLLDDQPWHRNAVPLEGASHAQHLAWRPHDQELDNQRFIGPVGAREVVARQRLRDNGVNQKNDALKMTALINDDASARGQPWNPVSQKARGDADSDVDSSAAQRQQQQQQQRSPTDPPEFAYDPRSVHRHLIVADVDGYVVPNVVHFVRFYQPHVTFVEMLAIRAALLNVRPDVLYVHCNKAPSGRYWDMIKDAPAVKVKYMPRPKKVFGRALAHVHHSSDVARLSVLRQHGGIYVDNDMLVLRPLDDYRRYEFTVGWRHGESMGNQLLIANKRSMFLRLYMRSYAEYNASRWYYNGGDLPTEKILNRYPWLVHAVPEKFGVTNLCYRIFHGPLDWRAFDALHLLYNHRYYLTPDDPIPEHDENSIRSLDTPFGEMARQILYGFPDALPQADGVNATSKAAS
ncbi:PREDICTED: uncharacterized protein LOC106816062 [Priapulus caudatus]|uniref:Uncharacterized protein LOC106816062 n=1 Tax=Priapulus caudatus TaxID=37621 RepID=A0ABM1EVB5_PRICU|nr:PREDICTED: uncharacterized protein LOC106816062 [Priapulus caudatus]XP_014676206.1 PREDICTED: uncharacterized protein LOC106816062 [Priapulus caudatus]XP_014676286.1 PREDICTED: uncharacterized protein LOC106816062 [Priapulus caudatus]